MTFFNSLRVGHRVALAVLVATPGVLILGPTASHAAQIPRSQQIAIVPNADGRDDFGGQLPTSGFPAYSPSFTNISPEAIRDDVANPLGTGFDTVVLNGICDIGSFLANAQFKSRIEGFVANGGKLIIWNSECVDVDYSNFALPFETNNPGQQGANGTLVDLEDNALSSSDPSSPSYVNTTAVASLTDAVGDSDVFTTFDQGWFVDLRATNVNGATGPAQAYGNIGRGLVIYSGLDKDYMPGSSFDASATDGPSQLNRIWMLELLQPWDPDNLPGSVRAFGLTLAPRNGSGAAGTSHTLTAHVTSQAVGIANISVAFSVTAGPCAGRSGTDATNAGGDASFTYSCPSGGTDTIVARATIGSANVSDTASQVWVESFKTTSASTWAGWVTTKPNPDLVWGRVRVPSVSCNGSGDVSLWVGFDGFTSDSNTVEQDGIDAHCDKAGGRPKYYAWYELFKGAFSRPFNNLPHNVHSITIPLNADVVPGDFVYMFVSIIKPDRLFGVTLGRDQVLFYMSLYDSQNRRKAQWTKTVEVPLGFSAKYNSTECILERPLTSSGPVPLPNFGVANFTDCSTLESPSSSLTRVNMVNGTTTLATTGAPYLSPSGSEGFDVTWVARQ